MDLPDMLDADDEVEANAVPDARASPPASRPVRAIPAFRVPSFLKRFVPIMKLPPGKTGHTPVVCPLMRLRDPPAGRIGPLETKCSQMITLCSDHWREVPLWEAG